MGLNRKVVTTMSLATGTVVANNYYAQPLEATLAREFHAPSSSIGLIITVIQIGYALGLATLVPLGDLLERRKLLVGMLSVTTLSLVVVAAAPTLPVLAVAAAVMGLTTVAAQVLVPFAAHLAPEGRSGAVISTVMSGLLIGILASRTLAGVIAQVAGWRTVFALGAVLTALMTVALWRQLPTLEPVTKMRYSKLLGSVLTLIREEPVLRRRMIYGALTYASFGAFWATVGFLLARPPYGWSDGEIGAFALLGVAGAISARFAGRLADRGLAPVITGFFLLATSGSYVFLWLGGHSTWALGIGVVLFDLGVQGAHICNQSLVYALRPEARSRLNTAYMTAYFIAGAAGSGIATTLYAGYGWSAVCLLGGGVPTVGLLLWIVEMLRRRSQRSGDPAAQNVPQTAGA